MHNSAVARHELVPRRVLRLVAESVLDCALSGAAAQRSMLLPRLLRKVLPPPDVRLSPPPVVLSPVPIPAFAPARV